ncbi:FBP domain-containing protein [Spongiactinospora rosea]|uniref:FBP domain-containing protein n=1 Tax=Spongiactinospora rosea TaxID=2248750 RepID=A0A366LYY5_9ACTN|nr:FBP domain-containing protein [Spongiactinospora rosea]RBQ18763.1 FBP domain-containing protein [Spongiactinospora rosea]
MREITESDIRRSFVNCSKGEAGRLGLPGDLAGQAWADLDFLGWRDPGAPGRAYLVAERGDRLVGVALRVTSGGGGRGFTARSMCSLCLTTHAGGGVALMAAGRVRGSGYQGDTVGRYLCGDLGCSLYLRGRKESVGSGDLTETLPVEQKIARLRVNLDAFLDKITM